MSAQRRLRIARALDLDSAVMLVVIACLFDLLMRWVERLVVPWKGRM